jgi:hypothetical protein
MFTLQQQQQQQQAHQKNGREGVLPNVLESLHPQLHQA